jgi:hypothetical protein
LHSRVTGFRQLSVLVPDLGILPHRTEIVTLIAG